MASAHVMTVTAHKASKPGALDGFDIRCAKCGYVGGYSIKSMSEQYAREHVTYMESVGR